MGDDTLRGSIFKLAHFVNRMAVIFGDKTGQLKEADQNVLNSSHQCILLDHSTILQMRLLLLLLFAALVLD